MKQMSNAVYVNGDQTVGGNKTFTNALACNGDITTSTYFKVASPVYVFARTSVTTFSSWLSPFDIIGVNDGNCYSTTTRRFTAPTKGLYEFTITGFTIDQGHIGLAYNADYVDTNLYNGAQLWHISIGQTGLSAHWVLKLNSGDYIRPIVYQTGTLNANRTYFIASMLYAIS